MQPVPPDFILPVIVPDCNENGQTYQEGKHIGWFDGFRALWCT